MKKNKFSNLKALKIECDLFWDKVFNQALEGNIKRDNLIYAMDRLNQIDKKLMQQKIKVK